MEPSPLVQANEFASLAEEYTRQNDFSNACTAHFRAAELFLLAMNDTQDPEAVKTLKLLYASHTRSGKELQRRLTSPRLQTSVGRRSSPPVPVQTQSIIAEAKKEKNLSDNQPSTYSGSNSIAQSYMILDKNASEFRHENEDDPFNKFWDAVEGLVQNTSGPVAITSAPLGQLDVIEDHDSEPLASTFLQSYMIIPPNPSFNDQKYRSDWPKPSAKGSTKTLEEYELENKQLKATVDMLAKKVSELERTQKENNMLRSSIIQFRQEVQKQRANHPMFQSMHDRAPNRSSTLSSSLDKGKSNLHQSIPLDNAKKSSQPSIESLTSKIQSLELELEKANAANAMHVKKWEKLKETARKKREFKNSELNVGASTSMPAGDRPPLVSPTASQSQSMYYSVNSRFQ